MGLLLTGERFRTLLCRPEPIPAASILGRVDAVLVPAPSNATRLDRPVGSRPVFVSLISDAIDFGRDCFGRGPEARSTASRSPILLKRRSGWTVGGLVFHAAYRRALGRLLVFSVRSTFRAAFSSTRARQRFPTVRKATAGHFVGSWSLTSAAGCAICPTQVIATYLGF